MEERGKKYESTRVVKYGLAVCTRR
jgi:hypothetical protein